MKPHYPLGKTPARAGAVKLLFKNYVDKKALPKPPASFGHEKLIGATAWQMLANDEYGCCVWSGGGHETMMWNKEAGKVVGFTAQSVLADYSAVTGFDPRNPESDQGTDMSKAAAYRRKTGLLDGKGARHKVAAYLALTPGDLKEHALAAFLFGAVGIGIEFPSSAMDQFNAGKPWDVKKGAKIEGGHYVPLVAKRGAELVCVTWARTQPMTPAFFEKYNDESIVYLSEEMLTSNKKSLEGFDLKTLQADLASITSA